MRIRGFLWAQGSVLNGVAGQQATQASPLIPANCSTYLRRRNYIRCLEPSNGSGRMQRGSERLWGER